MIYFFTTVNVPRSQDSSFIYKFFNVLSGNGVYITRDNQEERLNIHIYTYKQSLPFLFLMEGRIGLNRNIQLFLFWQRFGLFMFQGLVQLQDLFVYLVTGWEQKKKKKKTFVIPLNGIEKYSYKMNVQLDIYT